MASSHQNPASPSDASAARRPFLSASRSGRSDGRATPSAVRVVAVRNGEAAEWVGDSALDELAALVREPAAAVWVDVTSPSPELALRIGAALELHPLIVEDVLEGNQRAKIETTDGLIHVVMFHLAYSDRVHALELDFVLGHGYLLSVHDAGWDPRTTHHLRSGVGPVLRHGPDHLLWALADDIVDGYFPCADRLGDAIDDVQDEVVRTTSPETVERIFELKRELIAVRHAVSPVREIFSQLTNRDNPIISTDEIVYFRDVYDHVIRLTDELDNYRELASTTLDVYLTQVNNNLSVIMKRLTGVTVILAGVGAIAGIFGMSEAASALGGAEGGGFWIVVALTVALAAGAAVFLRRIDWI